MGKTGFVYLDFDPATTTFKNPTQNTIDYWYNYKNRKQTKGAF